MEFSTNYFSFLIRALVKDIFFEGIKESLYNMGTSGAIEFRSEN